MDPSRYVMARLRWRRGALIAVFALILGGLGALAHAATTHSHHPGDRVCDFCTHLDANPAGPTDTTPPPAPGSGGSVPPDAATAGHVLPPATPCSRAPPAAVL